MWCAIAHYHELALKGRNRSILVRQLVNNLRRATSDLAVSSIDSLPGRIRLRFVDGTDIEQLWQILQHRISSVFGIANYGLALSSSIDPTGDLSRLKEALGPAVQSQQFQSFRVTTKRGDKRFPKTSMDVSREVGGYIQELTGSRVDLTNPDLTIHLELLFESAFASFAKMPGPGGLTLGMSGKTVCLLSGGIDSPVAAYRMMKRGCHQIFVHFHSHPFVSRASQEKAEDLATHLTQYQYHSVLYLVPFGDIQRQIVLSVPPPFRIVLYRRFMIRIAEQIARRHRAWALVTGDSLGQVASQVPDNLTVIEDAAQLPLLRPLIAMDKIEITAQAQSIGTYETSIIPDQDCCTLFMPAHPAIHPKIEAIRKMEATLDIETLVQQGVEGAQKREYSFP
ncbi:MAG TPA: tRNA 4-thiouridine(8) synthase ThiI [Nitrospirales bacterium]|nr:tRNA 4-thiouridine(8) synthase ThiI [Nitrospirales bacterium]HIA14694.1 tRNA 4-thiouridine(8) synthase ThiI [Nitrospirales bacterium]HIB54896.1 tRNA 4-thiouridine(8) synthase ThiI [Nitrospirales bacterium]HIC04312.1 tRNA 4-thiouridine(8) synthase ThiI [Nitrospirales bacterium]HIN32440.1 tRNA 4-thiouridine(8) synthase ThiI [Nitrospirales bacterium]